MESQDNNTFVKPTVDQIAKFLDEYGWKYREANSAGTRYLAAPMLLDNDKSILITFGVSGDFVMVSTNGLFKNISKSYSALLLGLNDRIKLVKVFSTPDQTNPDTIAVDVGFELCYEAWNKETFFTFMDMLSLGAQKAITKLNENNIPYTTNYVEYAN